MAIPTTCPTCQHVKHIEELNDDPRIDPKFKLNELVQIRYRGDDTLWFRVIKIDNMQLTLEKA